MGGTLEGTGRGEAESMLEPALAVTVVDEEMFESWTTTHHGSW